MGFRSHLLNGILLLSSTFDALAQTDFSVTSADIYSWNQTEWSLTTKRFVPGQFQSRISLANGFVVHFFICLFGEIKLT
jgi:hypothetical protein